MKKIIKLFLMMMLLVGVTTTINVKANGELNFNTDAVTKHTEITSQNVSGMATLYSSTITSYNGRVINPAKLGDHNTYWLEPNQGILTTDLRLVSYSAGSATNWQGKKPTELARIFERENPGWMVLGGTNGDFFYISDNSEPLGTVMQEGDFYKPYDYKGAGHGGLGFFDDGSYIYGNVTTTANEYVQYLGEDGSVQDIAEILNIDTTPSEKGVTLLTRYNVCEFPFKQIQIQDKDLPYDLTDFKVYKITYTTQRKDRTTQKIFVKGVVTEITTNTKTYKINDSESASYLVCKDGSLDSLKLGDTVRCQVKATGEWENVSNIMGFYNVILENGKVVDYSQITDVNRDYVNCNKNRTIWGFKADGTPILMSVDKVGINGFGASYEECGEFLKAAGCVNGFLSDGGGSACLFVRGENGEFKTVNRQEDGNERSDGNALLLVMRKPGFKANFEAERMSVKVNLEKTFEENFNLISSIKVTINNETKDYKEGLVFEGLEENTEYDVKISYKIPAYNDNSKLVDGCLTYSFKTKDFDYPEPGLSFDKATKTTLSFKKDTSLETSSWIQDVVIHLGATTYQMGNNETYTIEGLIAATEYPVYFEYVIVDPETSKRYTMTTEAVTVKTLSYDLPEIKEFKESKKKENSLSVSYEYVDNDNLVEKAYILINGKEKELSSMLGSERFSDLDFTKNVYELTLVLEGHTKEGESFKITSEVLKYDEVKDEKPQEKKKKCGKKSAELIISFLAATSLMGIVLRKKK